MSKVLLIGLIILSFGAAFYFMKQDITPQKESALIDEETVTYVALGDSYTIGEGVTEDESWPIVLTKHLQKEGIDIELVANPARTGLTTQDVINSQLPLFQKLKPKFATLLIGVNDWVQGVDENTFRKNFAELLDQMQAVLPKKDHLIVITIPDFSATPEGSRFSSGRNITEGIGTFNQIIKEEAEKRTVPVVDIFPISQKTKGDPSLVAPDGLHPSGKGYKEWEELIFPVALDTLKP